MFNFILVIIFLLPKITQNCPKNQDPKKIKNPYFKLKWFKIKNIFSQNKKKSSTHNFCVCGRKYYSPKIFIFYFPEKKRKEKKRKEKKRKRIIFCTFYLNHLTYQIPS